MPATMSFFRCLSLLKWILFCLGMVILFRLIGAEQCVPQTFINDPALNGEYFNQALLSEVTDIKSVADCFAQCLQLPECNMLTVNTETNICRLHSVPYSHGNAQNASGYLYYSVACDDLKTNPVCTSHLYEPITNPIYPAQCYEKTAGWVNAATTIPYCRQILWESPIGDEFYFPTELVPGVELAVRGTRTVESNLQVVVYGSGGLYITLIAVVGHNDNMMTGTWDGTSIVGFVQFGTFQTALNGVEFDLLVTFTAAQFEVFLNGDSIGTQTLYNPLPTARYLFLQGFGTVSSVQIIYP